MFFTKVLSNSHRILSRRASPVKIGGAVVRQGHTKAVPPLNRQTTAQNIAMGILFSVSMWAIPFWVLYYIPEYQNEDRNVYTGR